MSRRPQNPSAERAAANQQILKNLVKIETNKTCADCKRNKHPRWASWNLGVFVCIRCSGIHRGMGTHISRVKSVDLDAWTDEQMQSIVRWGNARANKYWEAKLASGHIPSEAKIENFIRTKYESKRWVMDGPMPDPETLGDDEPAVSSTQETSKAQRPTSISAAPLHPPPPKGQAPAPKAAPPVDLFGDDTPPISSQRPDTALSSRSIPTPPPKNEPVAPRPNKAADSLLGFDFFAGSSAGIPQRPASASAGTANSNVPSRPDLKQSILSLYASAPKPASAAPPQPQGGGSFNPPVSPPVQSQGSFGSLTSDFSGLNFGSSPQSQQPTRPSTQLPSVPGNPAPSNRQFSPPISPPSAPNRQSGGGFFDPKPTVTTSPPVSNPAPPQRGFSSSSGFEEWTSMTSPIAAAPTQSNPGTTGGALMDFSTSPQPTSPPSNVGAYSSPISNSPFNLSATTQPKTATQIGTTAVKSNANSSTSPAFTGMDPWGSNDAWASSVSPPKPNPPPKAPATVSTSANDWGWTDVGSGRGGNSTAQVTKDEDFGGWGGTSPGPTKPAAPSKPLGGFGGNNDDLFSNVWE